MKPVMLVPEKRSEDGYGQTCRLGARPIVKRPLDPPPLRVEGGWRHALTCQSAKPTGRGGLDEIMRLSQTPARSLGPDSEPPLKPVTVEPNRAADAEGRHGRVRLRPPEDGLRRDLEQGGDVLRREVLHTLLIRAAGGATGLEVRRASLGAALVLRALHRQGLRGSRRMSD